MKVNLTLFVQIVNFGITYFFLKNYFFGPIVSHLKKQKKSKDEFLKLIEGKENCLVKLEHQKIENVKNFQSIVHSRYTFKNVPEVHIPLDIKYDLNKNQIEKMICVTKNILVKRVPHVD